MTSTKGPHASTPNPPPPPPTHRSVVLIPRPPAAPAAAAPAPPPHAPGPSKRRPTPAGPARRPQPQAPAQPARGQAPAPAHTAPAAAPQRPPPLAPRAPPRLPARQPLPPSHAQQAPGTLPRAPRPARARRLLLRSSAPLLRQPAGWGLRGGLAAAPPARAPPGRPPRPARRTSARRHTRAQRSSTHAGRSTACQARGAATIVESPAAKRARVVRTYLRALKPEAGPPGSGRQAVQKNQRAARDHDAAPAAAAAACLARRLSASRGGAGQRGAPAARAGQHLHREKAQLGVPGQRRNNHDMAGRASERGHTAAALGAVLCARPRCSRANRFRGPRAVCAAPHCTGPGPPT